ncbi:MAG: glutamate formimidoyltransferase [Nitrospira sp.]|nr:glutamate formimidoyltransferase [Nitrospira sp.]
MPPLVACIPNFSEGRDRAVIEALAAVITSVPDVRLLHRAMDADHHRSVLTFAGSPDAVGEAAWRVIAKATELIDLRRHEGVHPRIGATDVVPFVPLQDIDIDECVRLARRVGQRVGTYLQIPVFLYEEAASTEARRRLESIRKGGLTGLASRIEQDSAWVPDFGPPRLHETAGAIAIGARHPLIAFNVNLATTNLSIAKDIARSIRESNGGFPCLKAIGVPLASRGLVQVAMNLTDYHVTPLDRAFHAVEAEAAKRGVRLAGSEIVGLVPRAAVTQTMVAALRLQGFDESHILETALATAEAQQRDQTLRGFLDAIAAPRPTPGGGSVAAYVGALAASLGIMGARLGGHQDKEHDLTHLQQRLHRLVQSDADAYAKLVEAHNIPKQDPNRKPAVAEALDQATEVPLDIAELSCQVGRSLHEIDRSAKPLVRSDLTVGIHMAIAAAASAILTARENIKRQQNQRVKESQSSRLTSAEQSLEELKMLCYTPPPG